jgi:hypothetical protein
MAFINLLDYRRGWVSMGLVERYLKNTKQELISNLIINCRLNILVNVLLIELDYFDYKKSISLDKKTDYDNVYSLLNYFTE